MPSHAWGITDATSAAESAKVMTRFNARHAVTARMPTYAKTACTQKSSAEEGDYNAVKLEDVPIGPAQGRGGGGG